MAIPRIQIPKPLRRSFQKLMGLSNEQRNALLASLRDVPPTFKPSDLAEHVDPEEVGLAREDLPSVLNLLASINALRQTLDRDIDSFVKQIRGAAADLEVAVATGSDEEWRPVAEFLQEIVAGDHSLGIAAKAFDLSTEYSRIFSSARFLTDIRPVFRGDNTEAPATAVIVHNLKLQYFREGELEERYYAFQRSELVDLRDAITRAIEKEDSLRQFLTGVGFSALSSAQKPS